VFGETPSVITTWRKRYGFIVAAAMLLICLGAGPALAGGGTFGDDEEQALIGHPYFGVVKDAKGEPVAGAKVLADLKNGSVVVTTDEDGHFVIRGFALNVDPADVRFMCAKDGYKQTDISKLVQSDAPTAPVEIHCTLARQ